MKKTFYSVEYRRWGADHTETKWFDNKEEALECADQDYHDSPVAHTYRSANSIRKMEELIREQNMYD